MSDYNNAADFFSFLKEFFDIDKILANEFLRYDGDSIIEFNPDIFDSNSIIKTGNKTKELPMAFIKLDFSKTKNIAPVLVVGEEPGPKVEKGIHIGYCLGIKKELSSFEEHARDLFCRNMKNYLGNQWKDLIFFADLKPILEKSINFNDYIQKLIDFLKPSLILCLGWEVYQKISESENIIDFHSYLQYKDSLILRILHPTQRNIRWIEAIENKNQSTNNSVPILRNLMNKLLQ